MPHLIIAANRLPFSITKSPTGLLYHPSPGGMAAALSPVRDFYDATWVGWSGLERPLTVQERAELALPGYAHTVDIHPKLYDHYYNSVANTTLWPVLHGITPPRLYTTGEWQSTLAVTRQFVAAIAERAKPGDIIWIHDFHLFMLPGLLRQAGLTNPISFFLHVPFADPDLFKRLPHWQEILTSLRQTDFLGVQTARDKTYLLNLYQQAQLSAPNIQVAPVGIDYARYANAEAHPQVKTYNAAIQQKTKGKTVVLSISRLDYTKGIIEQLKAIDRLQTKHPRSNLLYKLIVAPSREALNEYRHLKTRIDRLVGDINKRHPNTIDYDYRTVHFNEIAAWYAHADIMVVTPLIDGMNLVAKEYIAARQKPGALILSKAAGAALQLKEALLVEPTNIGQIYAALQTALTMPATEQARRHAAMRQNVQHEDVLYWARSCLKGLRAAPLINSDVSAGQSEG